MKFLTAWNNNRKTVQVALGLLSLFALLLYTFWHTGGLLSHYISPGWMGRVAAFGVEVAIVSMSLRIGELGWTAPNAKPYKWTLGLTLAVSAFANLAEGHATKYGTELTVNAVPNIDVIQGVIGVAATALLSIVVYLLADIIGGDVQRAETRAATELVTHANDAPAWGTAQPTRADAYAVESVPGTYIDPPVPVTPDTPPTDVDHAPADVDPRYPRACACGFTATNGGKWARHARDCEHARRDKSEPRAALRVLRDATGD